jgi:hypothetical protein
VLIAPKGLKIGMKGWWKIILVTVLKGLPYKRDDSGIGCNSVGISEEYRGMLNDLELGCGGRGKFTV